MSQFINKVSEDSFKTDVIDSNVPVLVDFYADWCGPCKSLAPKLEEIAGTLGATSRIVKLDVDAAQGIATQFGVRGIPTLVLFKNGQEVGRLVGNQPKDAIVSLLKQHGV